MFKPIKLLTIAWLIAMAAASPVASLEGGFCMTLAEFNSEFREKRGFKVLAYGGTKGNDEKAVFMFDDELGFLVLFSDLPKDEFCIMFWGVDLEIEPDDMRRFLNLLKEKVQKQ